MTVDYRGFLINPLRHHQPFYIDGEFVHFGYNVCSGDGWINVMPGATWFRSIEDAKEGVDDLIEAGGMPVAPYDGEPGVAQRFWKLNQRTLDQRGNFDLGHFNEVWSRLSDQGVCDGDEGAEHRRVKSEWVRSGKPADIEAFIRRRANVGPDDDEIWTWSD